MIFGSVAIALRRLAVSRYGMLLALPCLASSTLLADYQGSQHIMPFNEPPISYHDAVPRDPVARLQKRMDKGETRLDFDREFGYLPAILKELAIPTSSQMLVFSKTSLQRSLISPQQPRAIYYNDDVYIGWVRWGPMLEISAADPEKGGMFYVLSQSETAQPRLVRNQSCLECHVSSKTLGVPGHLNRSFEVSAEGIPDDNTGGKLISHNTPWSDRWGGWYVTGRHGKQRHKGNVFGQAADPAVVDLSAVNNVTNLAALIDPATYLQPHSDIVALLVFAHQIHMHNFITRLNYEATSHLAHYGHINYLAKPVESFLHYLLFLDEPPMLSRVKGTSGYADWFMTQGPRDRRGRSLRDLDLYTRLFKYPCSFLIYSDAFEGLPSVLRERIYKRLWEMLNDPATETLSASLNLTTRQTILQIIAETKSGLPDYWKSVKVQGVEPVSNEKLLLGRPE